jgi:diguanylate cyclase (GGDEF)-like protein
VSTQRSSSEHRQAELQAPEHQVSERTVPGQEAPGVSVVSRFRLNAGQISLLVVLVALLLGLMGTLFAAQRDAVRHTDTATRTESSSTNALYVMRESLNYSLSVQQYLLGAETRRSVQISRALLAQRLSIVDENGRSAAQAAGDGYAGALDKLDSLVATLPAGNLPQYRREGLTEQLHPALDELESVARHLVDDSTSTIRAQSRAYDAQLVQTRAIELALTIASLIVGAVLVGWVAVGVRRNHLAASTTLSAQETELSNTKTRLDRMAALDRGHARILELIAQGADLPHVFEAVADAVSEVSGHQTRVRWGSTEIVRPERPSGVPTNQVGWSSPFGAGREVDGPGEVAILADPDELDEAARTGARRCRDLARLAVETDRASQRLSFQARHDALTGLSNRNVLLAQLDEQLFLAARSGVEVAVLFCDLDGFRVVNDALGHAAGDTLLIEAASRLRAEVRDVDLIARHGGDEFVVLCPMITDPDEAVKLAERLRRTLGQRYHVEGREVTVPVSIGVCYAEDPEVGGHELMRAADRAMRRAKSLGGDQIAVFDWDTQPAPEGTSDIGAEIARAVDRGELFVLMQPIVGLDDESLVGFEALVRWNRPGDDVWLPERFVPLAEGDGTIVDLDRWVLRQALGSLAGWHSRGLALDVPVSVNVSQHDVLAPGFVDEILFLLDEFNLPGSSLVLELKEEALVAVASTRGPLTHLRARGVRVSIDNFGTGHASITTLHAMPIDQVKLDRSLTRGLDADHRRTAVIVESVVLLASALSLDLVMEGVETLAERGALEDLGVRRGQGWLFGRPMTVDAAEQWMHDHRVGGGVRVP